MPFLGTVSLGNEAVFFISTLGIIGNYWEILGIIGNYWEILGIIGKVSCAIVVPLHPILRFKLLLHLSK